jgi:hypothetical protein
MLVAALPRSSTSIVAVWNCGVDEARVVAEIGADESAVPGPVVLGA